ncbi:MAG: Hsp20/alpha crystallin family protein [Minisyncoccia bacterium]
MPKPSFFQRLTGSVNVEEYENDSYDETEDDKGAYVPHYDDTPTGSELRVDVYQTNDSIVLRAFTPGVPPSNVELSLTRDMLTINAKRDDSKEAPEENYFTRELDWDPLQRTVLLPSEVDIDLAEATEQHGVLTIRMPKMNKDRETKVKVRSNR